ncbi:inosine-5'-monophosphate dehydrogenase 2-like [Pyrus ussuriensis x Pyrus communis]|uniref:Inosine-5'-monophosphate dehydrogenase 2-like n=1 Tax=Pyrus ussuriensis x Pyrus communis TaxID=2448454 RepID=A0A5N5IEM4_9ROSA|nr:inosine-5'-monophosphate dehydrogenase 2-like [Pyrus ussuriensis x Pyrus communis]
MGYIEAMTKGSELGGDNNGSVLKSIPYTMQAVKQGFQDLGASSLQSAHDFLKSSILRLESCSSRWKKHLQPSLNKWHQALLATASRHESGANYYDEVRQAKEFYMEGQLETHSVSRLLRNL